MGNNEPVLVPTTDPVVLEVANYIKEAKQQKDMAGFVAIAELIVERIRNESKRT